MSDECSPWAPPQAPVSGDTGQKDRAGCAGWIVLVFLVSSWLGAFVIFVLYGFNPGGSPVKEARWRGALIVWPALMALMLGCSVYFWRDRRHLRTWVVTLALMGTCPVWFPVMYALIIKLVAGALRM
jgi:hypothetical protein